MEAIKNFIKNVALIFSVNVITVGIVGNILGDSGIGSSSLFQLGALGLSYSTLCQQFLASFTIASTSYILGNENLIKKLTVATRIAIILISNFVIIAGFILVFKWIESAEILGWICYIISFIITSAVSAYFVLEKNRREMIEYNKCLSHYKEKSKRGS